MDIRITKKLIIIYEKHSCKRKWNSVLKKYDINNITLGKLKDLKNFKLFLKEFILQNPKNIYGNIKYI